jgi:hypothetical protein
VKKYDSEATIKWQNKIFRNFPCLLDICLKTYFQFEDKFFQQKEGTAVGNCLSLVVRNIFLERKLKKEHWMQQTTNPLNGSATLTTLSWFGHTDRQDCSNFFTTSTALNPLGDLGYEEGGRGPKLNLKMYWKPTPTPTTHST